MDCQIVDEAGKDRKILINTTIPGVDVGWKQIAESLADRCLVQSDGVRKALEWLDAGAPGRARQELINLL